MVESRSHSNDTYHLMSECSLIDVSPKFAAKVLIINFCPTDSSIKLGAIVRTTSRFGEKASIPN